MKNKTTRMLISGLLLSTVSSYTHASSGLSSPIDDGSFGAAEKQRMLLQTLTNAQSIVEAPVAAVTNGSITEDVRLGVVSDVKVAKGITQAYKKDAHATGTVAQGNISGSTVGGGVTQKFIGTVDAKKVEQGNISGTTIEGDLDQEF